MKLKKVIAGVVLGSLLFGSGAIAQGKGLMNLEFFEREIAQSEKNVGEIMEILRKVNSDKVTAEKALEELQAVDIEALLKHNEEQADEIDHLKHELAEANGRAMDIERISSDALKEAKKYESK